MCGTGNFVTILEYSIFTKCKVNNNYIKMICLTTLSILVYIVEVDFAMEINIEKEKLGVIY